MQSAIERRQQVLEAISDRRTERIENLASEFGVSRRTIERDILVEWKQQIQSNYQATLHEKRITLWQHPIFYSRQTHNRTPILIQCVS